MSTAHSTDPNGRDRQASGSVTATKQLDPEKPDRPSMLQMTASALTAVSATALLSFVGVWGTVFGMGLLSILTVLGNYMYSSFFQHTAEKVKQVRPVTPRSRGGDSSTTRTQALNDATRFDLEPITAEHPSLTGAEATVSAQPEGEDDRPPGRFRTAWRSMIERYGRRRIVLSIVAVFVVLAGTVTVVEVMAGKPVSDIVRNESGNGTSVFGGNTSGGSDTDDSDDSDGSGDPDQESERDPQDGDAPEEPPVDETPPDETPADESPVEDPPGDEQQQDEPQDEQTPADEPLDDEPPAEEPEEEQPPADDPEQEAPQQDAPPAD